jgi:hypothetical protein
MHRNRQPHVGRACFTNQLSYASVAASHEQCRADASEGTPPQYFALLFRHFQHRANLRGKFRARSAMPASPAISAFSGVLRYSTRAPGPIAGRASP